MTPASANVQWPKPSFILLDIGDDKPPAQFYADYFTSHVLNIPSLTNEYV